MSPNPSNESVIEKSQPLLFTPLQIGNVHLKNRIVIAPMCQYSATDGFAADWHMVHLGARAIGGAGVVMMEATAVEARGRISPGCTGIWKDEHIEPLKKVTAFVKSHGSVPAIQLAHSGRKGSTVPPWINLNMSCPPNEAWQCVAPSPIGKIQLKQLVFTFFNLSFYSISIWRW